MLLRGMAVAGLMVGVAAGFVAMGQGAGGQGAAGQAGAAAGGAKMTCAVVHATLNEAEAALDKGQFAQATQLYQAMLAKQPNDAAAKVGLVSSMIGEGKVAEALTLANEYAAASPNDPQVLEAVGEVPLPAGRGGRGGECVQQGTAAESMPAAVVRGYLAVPDAGGQLSFGAEGAGSSA